MARSISALLQDADDLISKKIASAVATPVVEDDVVKLAHELCTDKPVVDESVFNLTEKLAHAVALIDTLVNFETITKVAAFEDTARGRGYSDEQIAEFFEKRGSLNFRSVVELIPGFGG